MREYYLEQLLESLKEKNLPDEFKEHVKQQGITDETVQGLVKGNPRLLFDCFDLNNIFGTTFPDSKKFEFRWSILCKGDDGSYINETLYDTRKEAETALVNELFKLLEQKL